MHEFAKLLCRMLVVLLTAAVLTATTDTKAQVITAIIAGDSIEVKHGTRTHRIAVVPAELRDCPELPYIKLYDTKSCKFDCKWRRPIARGPVCRRTPSMRAHVCFLAPGI